MPACSRSAAGGFRPRKSGSFSRHAGRATSRLEDVLINIGAYVPLGFSVGARVHVPRQLRRARAGDCLVEPRLSRYGKRAHGHAGAHRLERRRAHEFDRRPHGRACSVAVFADAPDRRAFARLRREWFVYGPSAYVGIVFLCLWLATQLHPTSQLFLTGNLRGTFHLPDWFIHTPSLLLTSEAAIAALNVLGLGLMVLAFTRDVSRGRSRS